MRKASSLAGSCTRSSVKALPRHNVTMHSEITTSLTKHYIRDDGEAHIASTSQLSAW
jgi:hypothetical protein